MSLSIHRRTGHGRCLLLSAVYRKRDREDLTVSESAE